MIPRGGRPSARPAVSLRCRRTGSTRASQGLRAEGDQGAVVGQVAMERSWRLTRRGFLGALLGVLLSPPLSRTLLALGQLADPISTALSRVRGVRPRIYLNDARIQVLRAAIRTTHAPLWNEVRALADYMARTGPPDYRADGDEEQLWQRPVGNALPILAMAYVLGEEKRYLEGARQWALASCSYRTWGLGKFEGLDLAAGHQLFGLGVAYDWLFAVLDGETRQTIRETLVKRASTMFGAAAAGRIWWHRAYLQNHLWVNSSGMAAAGFALFDEVPEASRWISLSLEKFQWTMAALGPDGASHEGVGYWGYGVEHMLKFMHVARALLGINLYDHPWWRNTATYRQYLALPRNAWTRENGNVWTGVNNVVDIADSTRGNAYGPDYLLRGLAREYRDGYAQWLAQQIDEANVEDPTSRWLNLIWFDPLLEPKPPNDRPTLHHFEDMGIVSARSGWSGDESLVVFKCGPFIGHKAIQEFTYDPGGGHSHPDANHFVLLGHGEWLIRDDGYRLDRSKWTSQHNTLMIGGKGQLGDGPLDSRLTEPLRLKARPRVIRTASTSDLDHIAGDATEAYPRESGLRRFVRHLLFLKPNVLIVANDVRLDAPRQLEMRFHLEQLEADRDGHAFIVRGRYALLRIESLTEDEVGTAITYVPFAESKRDAMFLVWLRTTGAQWRNAVALSWVRIGETPARVSFRDDGAVWTFIAGDRAVTLNWTSGEAGMRARESTNTGGG